MQIKITRVTPKLPVEKTPAEIITELQQEVAILKEQIEEIKQSKAE